MSENVVNTQERVQLALREMYQKCGYSRFKVNKFEEYDFYAQNKSFLACKQVLTFSNTDGRLMALKPDITLSIIRSTTGRESLRKVYYTENVYRVPKNMEGFCEIPQTGLECIGDLDIFAIGEVVMLAGKSLEAISGKYVLDISHMGVISGILDAGGADAECMSEVFAAVCAKNVSELKAICAKYAIADCLAETLCALISMYGELGEMLDEVEAMQLPFQCDKAVAELRALADTIAVYGIKNVNLDFSVVNDAAYYSGFVFSGFVDGVAESVLSGGQYDRLLKKMGKRGGAIGFAVYLDQLEWLMVSPEAYDVDTLVIYKSTSDIPGAIRAAEKLRRSGESVRVQQTVPSGLTFRHKITVSGGEEMEDG